MFDELEKYTFKGNFFYRPTDSLEEVCNAPSSYYGVFLVYALRKGKVELIYIGKSGVELFGNANTEGHICDGLRDNLVDGLHFDETSRKNCWPVQMFIEDIEALHVHWYVTYDGQYKDRPGYIKIKLLQVYQGIFGKIPRWNFGSDRT
ncbi:hypothetical protein B0O44_107240 [Pedobacter nutrimenti]|jgi:hypothetical protein|uniref:GIY-YIG domain-containing protein n=2 Tax=Pedobacter nutrimenti TaxID=1241337 RepID=A0A318UAT3_9SPHI|nr:hypothetical protein B0O44_107240 [Pedobacter nutrimenti]